VFALCLAVAGAWAGRLGEPAGSADTAVCDRFGDLRFFNVG
jgi:hypothetical protein